MPPLGGDDRFGVGDGALGNIYDAAIGANENHVEGDQRIAHPHGYALRKSVIEQHAGVGRHGFPKHQAARLLGVGNSQFHIENFSAFVGIDGQLAFWEVDGILAARGPWQKQGCQKAG